MWIHILHISTSISFSSNCLWIMDSVLKINIAEINLHPFVLTLEKSVKLFKYILLFFDISGMVGSVLISPVAIVHILHRY